jgi:hypothetical protein
MRSTPSSQSVSSAISGSGALGGKGSGGGTWKAPALRCEGKWKAERQQ